MSPRIIPAYAGSTTGRAILGRFVSDHPRIRGEHVENDWIIAKGGRIIPAYAGSTHAVERARIEGPDHPRIRGEHSLRGPGLRPARGSSPHTRGARRRRRARLAAMRIIPAYAGSTTVAQSANGHGSGSSPHTRGARRSPRKCVSSCRIIPAYAGSTLRIDPRDSGCWDHPRIRGEHAALRSILRMSPGSSPHTRGAPHHGVPPGDDQRDHPRIRGEHSWRLTDAMVEGGSSPHTRGAR